MGQAHPHPPVAELFSTEHLVETRLRVKDVGCSDLEPLWLMAQSVPSASLVPCLQLVPVDWTVANVAVNNSRSVITLRFRARTLGLLEGRWVPITAATLVSHLSYFLVLLLALRHVEVSDAEVSWVQVLAWFAGSSS